ncbi:MAG: hypothetical protein ABI721_01890 [Candidatus Dojkabacteria bacterium]
MADTLDADSSSTELVDVLPEETTVILNTDETLGNFDNNQLKLIASLGSLEMLIQAVNVSSLGGFESKKWLNTVKKLLDDFKSSDPTFSVLALKNGSAAAKDLFDFICALTVHINKNIDTNGTFTFMGQKDRDIVKELEAFCVQLKSLLGEQ